MSASHKPTIKSATALVTPMGVKLTKADMAVAAVAVPALAAASNAGLATVKSRRDDVTALMAGIAALGRVAQVVPGGNIGRLDRMAKHVAAGGAHVIVPGDLLAKGAGSNDKARVQMAVDRMRNHAIRGGADVAGVWLRADRTETPGVWALMLTES